jgi:predicted phage-related endonuclease
MEDDLKNVNLKNGRRPQKYKFEKIEDDLKKMEDNLKNMEDSLKNKIKWKTTSIFLDPTRKTTSKKINLIGCDTIVN